MTAYIGILEKEPGTLWGVWFPDLAGCVTAAESVEEAVTQASEVLEAWLDLVREDGHTPRSPRTIEELRCDPEVAQALAAGCAAIVVRPPADEFGLDARQLKAVDTAAERRGLSRTELIRMLILNEIAN